MWFFLCDAADADEPPRSDAGQDVVIQLPTDWAVLDGRDSVDDRGINRYDWTLVKGDTAINMKVSVSSRRWSSYLVRKCLNSGASFEIESLKKLTGGNRVN